MHVFLTGATGFVGHYVLRELRRQGHTVRCLVRPGSLDGFPVPEDERAEVDTSQAQIVEELLAEGEAPPRPPRAPVEIVYGDVVDLASIEGDLAGCDAVIHLVGIIEEDKVRGVTFENVHVRGTRHVVEQARVAGVSRIVHMSANGARPDAPSDYHTTKWTAEEIVRQSGFEHAVVFRPSILFGAPGEGQPEFASRLADTLVRPFPILPVFGDGTYAVQPIHVEEVARAFVQALALDTEGVPRSYCAAGREEVPFDDALDRIAQGMGRQPKRKAHLPLGLSRLLVDTVGAAGLLPISPAQFRMLIEGNTCDPSAFLADFGIEPRPFTPDNLSYLRS
jgi:uncharacterized protein YbjT (DUF2867 family)